ncbi:MAG: DUF2089 domain-containing protein [Chloroflexota bacterium]|nr:MAG: DUF2089 domain-containing protein [Chloroflexota bacterium]
MNRLPNKCPICSGEIAVTRIYCRSCDTTIEGRFEASPFGHLTHEQLAFIETFVRNEGRINRMESDLKLSYPTIRNRLHEVIRALGYEPGGEEVGGALEEKRQRILEDLDQGLISAEEAMKILQDLEA